MGVGELYFRKAGRSDSDLLFRWRNDPDTRKNSVHTTEVSLSEHEAWIDRSLLSPDRELYIALRGHDPIGTVRLDRRGDISELSWTVAPEARGRGLGKQMVRAAVELFPGPIIAQVKTGNEASLRIVQSCGFKKTGQEGELTTWRIESTSRIREFAKFIGPRVLSCLIAGLVLGLALSLAELALAYGIQSFLITLGLMSESTIKIPSWVPARDISAVVAFVALGGIFRSALQWGQAFLQGASFEEFCYLQRNRLLRWAFRSDRIRSDEVMSLFGQKTVSAAQSLMLIQTGLTQLTVAVLLSVALFKIAPWMTLVSFVGMGILLVPLKFVNHRIGRAGQGIAHEWDITTRVILTSIKNLLLLEIYGTRGKEEARAATSVAASRELTLSHYRNTGVSYALPQIFSVLLVCVLGLSTRHRNGIPASLFVSYIYLFVRIAQNLAEIARSRSSFGFYWPQVLQLQNWWKAHRIALNAAASERKSEGQLSLPPGAKIGWELKDLAFRYDASTPPLFENLNLRLLPGTATVILGPSGAGKTTLLSLLLGMLQPTEGDLSIKADERSFPLEPYRRSLLERIGYVGAESFLIDGTIRDNLAYGLIAPPDQSEIEKALAQAQCQFIFDLPKGLDHPISEQGQGLSAGQKQRISLARAILRKPKVLLLDEATANLDVETESKLIETLTKLKGEMTLVIVTHREAMLRLADQELRLGR